jgi:hypothetical protein
MHYLDATGGTSAEDAARKSVRKRERYGMLTSDRTSRSLFPMYNHAKSGDL